MIAVEGLAVGFGDEPLLEDLSFEVERGEVFCVLGFSGSGKTTLMRHMIGLQRPMRGRVTLEGVGEPELSFDHPPPFGVMFQRGALFGSMTLADNLALPLEMWTDLPRRAVDAVVRAKLQMVGLGGFENHAPDELSGGMQTRAAIARALMLEPPLLFLDEPTSGLDPKTAAELDGLLESLRDDLRTTLVVITHELESILRVADRCVLLDAEAKGIIARGDPRELRERTDDPRVYSFFNRAEEGEAEGASE